MVNKMFLVTVSISLLIIAGSIAYYFIFYLPQKDQAQLQAQKEQQTQIEVNKRSQIFLQSACLDDAEKNYQATWASDCKLYAQQQIQGYQNCLQLESTLTNGQSFCHSLWKAPDTSPSCSLPSAMADSLNSILQQDKNNCFKEYSQ